MLVFLNTQGQLPLLAEISQSNGSVIEHGSVRMIIFIAQIFFAESMVIRCVTECRTPKYVYLQPGYSMVE